MVISCRFAAEEEFEEEEGAWSPMMVSRPEGP